MIIGWRQADFKPNSVRPCGRGDHSSRPPVSRKLKQPTRKLRRAAAGAAIGTTFPYLALLHVGFAKPIRLRTAGALLPHLFTLTGAEAPAVCFLWHFPSLTGPRVTRHTALRSSDFPRGFPRDHPSACQLYDFMLLSNFCNSGGRSEWNSMATPVVGWVKRRLEACKKNRWKSSNFFTNSL
jgi:hypothetical protein